MTSKPRSAALPSSILGVPILLALIASGCGGGSSSSKATSARVVLPASGGTITSSGVTLVVPAGALASDTTISIASANDVPDKERVVNGTAFTFTPTTFGKPVRLTYRLGAGALDDAPALYKLVDGAWVPMPSTTDATTNSVSGLVETFSTYAVLKADTSLSTVVAEAMAGAGGAEPQVSVSWSSNAFAKGSGIVSWQVYRNGVTPSPVHVKSTPTSDSSTDVVGVTQPDYENYTAFSDAGSDTQRHTSLGNVAAPVALPAATVGTPYAYSIDAVYMVPASDLPGGTSGSSSGTTAGGTTAGTTSGSTTSTSGDSIYYFQTLRQNSGTATPLAAPTVNSPSGSTISDSGTLLFVASVPSGVSTPVQYVVEASATPDFLAYRHVGTVTTAADGTITVPLVGLSAAFESGSSVYVRVGARNPRDVPGPGQDSLTHERFLFGAAQSMLIGS